MFRYSYGFVLVLPSIGTLHTSSFIVDDNDSTDDMSYCSFHSAFDHIQEIEQLSSDVDLLPSTALIDMGSMNTDDTVRSTGYVIRSASDQLDEHEQARTPTNVDFLMFIDTLPVVDAVETDRSDSSHI
jgi:hypothetical protein